MEVLIQQLQQYTPPESSYDQQQNNVFPETQVNNLEVSYIKDVPAFLAQPSTLPDTEPISDLILGPNPRYSGLNTTLPAKSEVSYVKNTPAFLIAQPSTLPDTEPISDLILGPNPRYNTTLPSTETISDISNVYLGPNSKYIGTLPSTELVSEPCLGQKDHLLTPVCDISPYPSSQTIFEGEQKSFPSQTKDLLPTEPIYQDIAIQGPNFRGLLPNLGPSFKGVFPELGPIFDENSVQAKELASTDSITFFDGEVPELKCVVFKDPVPTEPMNNLMNCFKYSLNNMHGENKNPDTTHLMNSLVNSFVSNSANVELPATELITNYQEEAMDLSINLQQTTMELDTLQSKSKKLQMTIQERAKTLMELGTSLQPTTKQLGTTQQLTTKELSAKIQARAKDLGIYEQARTKIGDENLDIDMPEESSVVLINTTPGEVTPKQCKTNNEQTKQHLELRKKENKEIEALRLQLPKLDEMMNLERKVGEGTFSSVYLATLRSNPKIKFAVKHLTPICHPTRIKRELECLRDIGGVDNVSGINLCLRNGGCVAFIMPYQPHVRFNDYVLDMNADEARCYMKNLLIALRRVHSFNIIHRDVKPGNFLYDRETKKFLLVDFGLAQTVNSAQTGTASAKIELERKFAPLNKIKKTVQPTEQPTVQPTEPKTKLQKATHNRFSVQLPKSSVQPIKHVQTAKAVQSQSVKLKVQQSRASSMIQQSTALMHSSGPKSNQINTINPSNPSNITSNPTNITSNSSNKPLDPTIYLSKPSNQNRSQQLLAAAKSMKRKREEDSTENMNQKNTTLTEKPAKRPALQTQIDNQRNIITPLKPSASKPRALFQVLARPTSATSQFQLLAPPTTRETSQNNASYVRVQNSRVKMVSAPSQKSRCTCLNKAQVCEVCLKRPKLVAPRAGTPGFRPPEVLLKSMHQTTAVDMWAAGVLLVSILSGCYPFFKSPDDMSALAEVISLLGTKAISDTAKRLDRVFICDKERAPIDMQALCIHLRTNRLNRLNIKSDVPCSVCGPSVTSKSGRVPCLCPSGTNKGPTTHFPQEAYDLLRRLLDPNPDTRITAEQALNHPFITQA